MKDIWDIKERQRTELTSDDDHVSFETFCFYALLALQQLRQRRNRQLSLYRGLIKEELFFISVAATEFVKEGKGSFRFTDTGLIKDGVFFVCLFVSGAATDLSKNHNPVVWFTCWGQQINGLISESVYWLVEGMHTWTAASVAPVFTPTLSVIRFSLQAFQTAIIIPVTFINSSELVDSGNFQKQWTLKLHLVWR